MAAGRPLPRYTLGPAVSEFARKYTRHTKGPLIGRPFEFEPWQQDDWNLIYETDANGVRAWNDVVYGVARGNGKSPAVAVAGLFELLSRRDAPEIYAGAGAKDQAAIIHEFCRGMIEKGPLGRYILPQRGLLKLKDREGFLKVLSADGLLQHGLSPSVGLIDEWHAFTTEKQEELVNALASALHKRFPWSLMWYITTAGFNKASQLGQRYDKMLAAPEVIELPGLIIAMDRDARALMIWRGAAEDADIEDPAVWRFANPGSWLDSEGLRVQKMRLPELVFRRLHLNQWTKSSESWLPSGAWRACGPDMYRTEGGLMVPSSARDWGEIPDSAAVYIGVDIGLKDDSSAVVIAWMRDDGVIVVKAKIWSPQGDGTPMDFGDVEQYLRDCRDRYVVQQVAYDPHMFQRSAQLLSDEGLWMIEFPQSNERMAPASELLRQLVTSKRIEHNGDPLFADHVASGVTTSTDRGWRITKRKATGKVDALIALVIAAWHAGQSYGTPGVE